MLGLVLAATAASTPPVTAMSAAQLMSTLNSLWTAQGEPAFVEPDPPATGACSGPSLCVKLKGGPARVEVVTLTGSSETRVSSGRYLLAQAMLVRLTAPGAPMRPAVTADRLAVEDGRPVEAQLGPTCMRAAVSGARTLVTTFSRRRCTME